MEVWTGFFADRTSVFSRGVSEISNFNILAEMEAEKIVYVSCNAATQARDLLVLKEKYDTVKIQPVDMFPHTQHVENVVLLELRTKIV